MKKIALYISMALLAVGAFTSCTGEQAQPPVIMPEGGVGNGEWNDPMTVYQASLGSIATETKENEDGTEYSVEREQSWVTGYIVGYVDVSIANVMKEETVKFTVPATVASNIVLAAKPDETDWTKCVPVQLPSGEVRNALNLVDHPENAGALVTIYGTTGSKYCSVYGVRSVSKYKWGKKGIFTPKTIFSAPFTNTEWSGFTVDNGGEHTVWSLDYRYGLVAKGRFDNVNYALNASAISPEIFISESIVSPVLTFDWAGMYFSNVTNFKKYVIVKIRTVGEEWQDIDVPVYPTGSTWDFVNCGAIDLSAYKGSKIQFGFFYESTTSISGTLEIRNIMVLDAKQYDEVDDEDLH